MALVCGQYNARSDWLSARSERSLCSRNAHARADYGLCKLGRARLWKFKRIETMKALKTVRESKFNSELLRAFNIYTEVVFDSPAGNLGGN